MSMYASKESSASPTLSDYQLQLPQQGDTWNLRRYETNHTTVTKSSNEWDIEQAHVEFVGAIPNFFKDRDLLRIETCMERFPIFLCVRDSHLFALDFHMVWILGSVSIGRDMASDKFDVPPLLASSNSFL